MPELTSLPGQIMHSTTAEKVVQPEEIRPEVAAQQGVQAAEELAEQDRRTVRRPESKDYGRVEPRGESEKEGGCRRRRPKKGQPEAEQEPRPEEMESAGQNAGRFIDVVV